MYSVVDIFLATRTESLAALQLSDRLSLGLAIILAGVLTQVALLAVVWSKIRVDQRRAQRLVVVRFRPVLVVLHAAVAATRCRRREALRAVHRQQASTTQPLALLQNTATLRQRERHSTARLCRKGRTQRGWPRQAAADTAAASANRAHREFERSPLLPTDSGPRTGKWEIRG